MSTLQIVLISLALTGIVALAWLAFAGPDAGKAQVRRLKAIRVRHSDNALDRVEAQMKKAVAQR